MKDLIQEISNKFKIEVHFDMDGKLVKESRKDFEPESFIREIRELGLG